jgi:hypothetical protein
MDDAVQDAGNAILYVGVGLIVAEIPRLFCLCKLCAWVCCGGKTRDTIADREGIVMAMNALAINQVLSALLIIIITLAVGRSFGGQIIQFLVNFVIGLLITVWWRMDLSKWVQNKKDLEAA